MNIDMTLLDVKREDGCIAICKKPFFVFIDYETMPNRCLLYIVDTSMCWEGGAFNGKKAKINKQMPRSVSKERIDEKLLPCTSSVDGRSGVYHSKIKPLHAIKARFAFTMIDFEGETNRIQGQKGDWIVSDGIKNKVYTEKELKEQFILSKPYNFAVPLRAPNWERDQYGMPAKNFQLFAFSR